MVHSDLIISYPAYTYPFQWFLLSAFFFMSGYLTYSSFKRRNNGIRRFMKAKAKSLYSLFLIACIFYFVLQFSLGLKADMLKLISQISMANIIDSVNSVYNWGSLWFIPYLLVFMFIIIVLEKYIKSMRLQLLIVSPIWLGSILLWVYDSPLKLGLLFSEFIFVFMIGFWINKLKLYQKVVSKKTAFFAVLLIVLLAYDLSNLFNFNSAVQAFKALVYTNIRIVGLSLSAVLLALLFLRKIEINKNRFVRRIARRSAFVYLSEPFISFLILHLMFQVPEIYVSDGLLFIIYQFARVMVLLFLLPLFFIAVSDYLKKRASTQAPASY
jgi:fucose 4-O-acetylase-like acetyltransferase